ncbi:rod shape-determining protein MreD [Streptococcus anginosus]|uniref:Rod shape-determining protein MreD n=1 Tax=Streptococcus periodonticum TaxID=2490633 RepID=A0A3Q9EXE5_9STRE|nr:MULTISPECIES: rod shape-determining protein MreD [Streptococcus]AZQ40996.1 rod shape-determining protein MreD [Streptococcus periodonticum]MBX9076516.1 rod shape-determining protein MreD [Streptococcus anginosus]MCW1051619.1 rod shape-determining protein MreD [Streptococcus anginosus]MDU3555099.1 rod shape-determining protein MreD [Streptococcus anginosus]RGN66116.1 rod shape-determining protein MreD [Streptococcus anginosus]
MKFFKSYILPFLVLFVVMLVDGHLSNLLTNLFPNNIHLLSHLLLIFILYISINLSENTNFIMLLLIGLLYDAYYFHIIGISTLLLPLVGIVISKYNSVLMSNRVSRFLTVAILVFFFEVATFALANVTHLAQMSFADFVVYTIAPTMVSNLLFFLLLQPILEKIYL